MHFIAYRVKHLRDLDDRYFKNNLAHKRRGQETGPCLPDPIDVNGGDLQEERVAQIQGL